MYTFYALLNRMKLIERWSLMRSTTKEDLMQHAAHVAIVGQALGIIRNEYFGGSVNTDKIAALALYHDTAEVVSGDLPTPIKYYSPKIKNAYGEIETVINRKLLGSLPPEMSARYAEYLQPDENTEEYKLMKVADKLSAYIKCIDEKLSGNQEFDTAFNRLKKQLDGMRDEYPELKFFLDNFGEGYGKPLDIL